MLPLNSFTLHWINHQSDTCLINLPNLLHLVCLKIFTNSLAPSSLSDMHAFDTAWSCEILHCISTRACCANDAMEQSPIICHDASSHLLFYDANLRNKQMTMENIWIDMYPYPQDLLWQCWPSVELCILRFLHDLDQYLAPHVCKGRHSLICKNISWMKIKVQRRGKSGNISSRIAISENAVSQC